MASWSNWILLAVTCNLQIISWTWTVGRLIFSYKSPNLDIQSASWLFIPLICLILKVYSRVLINMCWILDVACVRILASAFSNGFCSFSRWNILVYKEWLNFSISQANVKTQVQLQHMFLVQLETFTSKVYWVAILEKYCIKTFQAWI